VYQEVDGQMVPPTVTAATLVEFWGNIEPSERVGSISFITMRGLMTLVMLQNMATYVSECDWCVQFFHYAWDSRDSARV